MPIQVHEGDTWSNACPGGRLVKGPLSTVTLGIGAGSPSPGSFQISGLNKLTLQCPGHFREFGYEVVIAREFGIWVSAHHT